MNPRRALNVPRECPNASVAGVMENLRISMRWMALLVALGTIASSRAAASEWVHPGPDGKLVYKTTPAGDRIMDFSFAGYMGGGVALPDVPVVKTVKPTGGEDDTETIQKAI